MSPKRTAHSQSPSTDSPLGALHRAHERLASAESADALIALLPAVACELLAAPCAVLAAKGSRGAARVLSSHGIDHQARSLAPRSDASQLAIEAGRAVTWCATEGPALPAAGNHEQAFALPVRVPGQPPMALACYREAPFAPDERELGLLLLAGAEAVWARLLAEEAGRISAAQLRQAEFQNQQLREHLGRAERLKADFVANMSHELRTPLNVVLGFSSLLVDEAFGELNAQQAEAGEKVVGSAERLATLINDLLDFSRLQAGMFDFQLAPLDLPELLADLRETICPLAEGKQLTVEYDVDPKLPRLEADEARMRQALLHLLDNALKFTESGGRIGLRAQLSPNGQQVVIEVWDTGIGIPPNAQVRLFERFYQVDSSSTRLYGGTGIGLSLVKELVEGHGGQVGVESAVGKGSTFRIVLPVHRGAADEELVG